MNHDCCPLFIVVADLSLILAMRIENLTVRRTLFELEIFDEIRTITSSSDNNGKWYGEYGAKKLHMHIKQIEKQILVSFRHDEEEWTLAKKKKKIETISFVAKYQIFT